MGDCGCQSLWVSCKLWWWFRRAGRCENFWLNSAWFWRLWWCSCCIKGNSKKSFFLLERPESITIIVLNGVVFSCFQKTFITGVLCSLQCFQEVEDRTRVTGTVYVWDAGMERSQTSREASCSPSHVLSRIPALLLALTVTCFCYHESVVFLLMDSWLPFPQMIRA